MTERYSPSIAHDGYQDGSFIPAFFAAVLVSLVLGAFWLSLAASVGSYGIVPLAGMVGLTIRVVGRGSSPLYGLLGVTLTLIPAAIVAVYRAVLPSVTPETDALTILGHLDYAALASAILDHMSVMDYILHGLSLLTVYFISKVSAIA